jgi:hypothetical protein
MFFWSNGFGEDNILEMVKKRLARWQLSLAAYTAAIFEKEFETN